MASLSREQRLIGRIFTFEIWGLIFLRGLLMEFDMYGTYNTLYIYMCLELFLFCFCTENFSCFADLPLLVLSRC